MFGNGNLLFSQQITYRMTIAAFFQVFHIALINDFSSQAAGIRTDIDDVIGGTDYFFIVLYHYHCVSEFLQLTQYADQTVGVTAVQTNTRLIQNIETADEAAS